ncbi:MAG TPA: hypothetical protein V6D29_08990 [Leptolyngbyaceae cyanobacterium]
MSSAASYSSEFPQNPVNVSAESTSLRTPPTRPTLVSPPKRPIRPSAERVERAPKPEPLSSVKVAPQATHTAPAEEEGSRYQPIAPPSEPMQYRAIGLIRGTYTPGDEQFNRGVLTTDDGATIEAVLLGRVTSLVKKHLVLADSHLWVVYPRTRQVEDEASDQDLQVQIVGVWEPETLGLPEEETNEDLAGEGEANATEPIDASNKPKILLENLPPVNENYFSIRGEIIHYDEDTQVILVKILQGLKRPAASRKSFRLLVQGTLQGRTVGYFWDLDVKRDAKTLVLDQGTPVGIVPPKKRKRGIGSGGPRRSGPPRRGASGAPSKRPFSPRSTTGREPMGRERPLPGSSRISEAPKRRES